ncbi:MAG: hypothetical protein IPJ17_19480 [Holophagales bacterium]|nr:MAG: hypothetical protein IPJ17_19480 [Holophagales bacterium]
MRTLRVACSLLGPAILLGSWLTQQFVLDRWRDQLGRLASAESSWDIYRSSNLLFNGLNGVRNIDSDTLKRWQLKTLEVGLGKMEAALDEEILRQEYSAVLESEDGGSGDAFGAMELRFKASMKAIERQRAGLRERKNRAQFQFWIAYLGGSSVVLLGATLKAAEELRSAQVA